MIPRPAGNLLKTRPRAREGAATALLVGAVGAVVLAAATGCSPAATDAPPVVPAPTPDALVEPAARAPNVLLLVMDTVRADRCGFLGYERATTPHLDRFAARGVTYTNAWSPSRWTVPSHASLFTGLLPASHECRPSLGTTLRQDVPTVAETLQDAGYATAAYVSNPAFDMDPGLLRGFGVVRRVYGLERPPGAAAPLCDELHGMARAWVHSTLRGERPFFLFVNDVDPHSPYQPHPDQQQRLVREDATLAEIAAGRRYDAAVAIAHNFDRERLRPRALAILSDLYDAEIATIDMFVGKFLTELERDGALENTLVIITSDHGEYLGSHGLLDHMHGQHQEVLRVPLLISGAGAAAAATRVDDIVRLEDIAPTILEVCGVAPPAPVEGRSLLLALPGRVARGESPFNPFALSPGDVAPEAPAAIPRVRPCKSVARGTWHLIAYDDGTSELYDRSQDLGETSDVAADHPELVAELRALLD